MDTKQSKEGLIRLGYTQAVTDSKGEATTRDSKFRPSWI